MVDRLRYLIAIEFGLGLAPIASGTFGSLPGLLIVWGLWRIAGWPPVVVAFLAVTGVGLWAAEGAARRLGAPDPSEVVVDEGAGQILTLLFVTPTVPVLVAGFLLFRVLDIVKPFPAGRLERLPGGSGIMADDLVAGIYGNLLLQAAVHFLPGYLGLS